MLLAMTKPVSIKGIMFHANDAEGCTVAWGHVANAFMLEDNQGLRDTTRGFGNDGLYDDLCEALADLMVASGKEGHEFTITPNPYGE